MYSRSNDSTCCCNTGSCRYEEKQHDREWRCHFNHDLTTRMTMITMIVKAILQLSVSKQTHTEEVQSWSKMEEMRN